MRNSSGNTNQAVPCPPPEDVVQFVMEEQSGSGALKEHVEKCGKCSHLVEEVRETTDKLRKLEPLAARPGFVADVLQGISETGSSCPESISAESRRLSIKRWRVPAAIAAGLLLAVGAGLLSAHRRESQPVQEHADAETSRAAAVDRGIGWLLEKQESSGGWDVAGFGGKAEYSPALNGLAAMAVARVLDNGEARTASLVRAGRFLAAQQSKEGRFGKDFNGVMYNQGIATLALLKILASTGQAELSEPIELALSFIRSRQSPSGGWGYDNTSRSQSNTSITSWQVQSLLAAAALGWDEYLLPARKGLAWMSGTVNDKGLFGYHQPGDYPEGPGALTMMGAYCLSSAGRLRILADDELAGKVQRGVARAAKSKPRDYYGAFFYVAALNGMDATRFKDALTETGAAILARQEAVKGNDGAWPANDKWSKAGGKLYSTSMALMSLSPEESAVTQRSTL